MSGAGRILGIVAALLGFQSIARGASPFPLVETVDNPQPGASSFFGGSLNEFHGNLLVGAPNAPGTAYLMDLGSKASLLTFHSPDAGNGANSFGSSVLGIGQNIVVADSHADVSSKSRAGSVYVFDGVSGNFLRTIHEPTVRIVGGFGGALQSINGQLLIAAGNQSTSDSGIVYDFNPATGQLVRTISSPDANSVGYGFGSDMQTCNGSIFISSTGAPVSGVTTGAVYRFDGSTFAETLKISNPDPQLDAFFGKAISTSSTALLVGAPLYDTGGMQNVGQAYLFDASTGVLLRTFLNPEPSSNSQFGESVSLIGHFAIVSAPYVPTPPGNPPFGYGAAYVFDTATGNYVGKITDPTPSQNLYFTNGTNPHLGVATIGNLWIASSMFKDIGVNDSAGTVYAFLVPEPSSFFSLSVGMMILALAVFQQRRQRPALSVLSARHSQLLGANGIRPVPE